MSDIDFTPEEMRMCRRAINYYRPGEEDKHCHLPVFATVSGAHLYGWADEHSDYDIRGIHVADPRELLGVVRTTPETIDRDVKEELLRCDRVPAEVAMGGDVPITDVDHLLTKTDIDIVSHELGKFVRLLCKPNGNFLEVLHSPLIVTATDSRFEELRRLSHDVVCKKLANHYLGFYAGQRKRYSDRPEKRLRQVLYGYRVLLTGRVLMRPAKIVSNLPDLLELADWCPKDIVNELMAMKRDGQKDCPDSLFEGALAQQDLLLEGLEYDAERSDLPEKPKVDGLNDWLIKYRMYGVAGEVDRWRRAGR